MRYWLSLVLFWGAIISSAAQEAFIRGTIKNGHADPLPGAAVWVLNTGLQAVADSNGSFLAGPLKPGGYVLQVTAPGYAGRLLTVHTDSSLRLDVILPLQGSALDEVVVTALKKEENPLSVPGTVTVLDAKAIEARRFWNLADLSGVSAGLFVTHPGDNRNVSSVRGIVSSSYEPAVVTYVDGVSQFNLDTYIPQLFDVERVEVLKGPQGTLYGRNAMGGVINVVTRKPGNYRRGTLQLTAGNYGLKRVTGSVQLPLVKDHLFIGGAGLFETNGGYYINQFTNTSYDRRSNIAGNLSLRYLPAQRWSVLLNTKISRNRNNGAFPLVMGQADALANPYQLNQNAVSRMVDNTLNASLAASYKGKKFSFSSQTAFQSNYRFYEKPIDADFSPADAVSIINNYGPEWNNVSVWTQELSLGSTAGTDRRWSWSAGSFLFIAKSPVKQTTRFGADAEMMGQPEADFSLISTMISRSRGAAVYGNLGFALRNDLIISAGLRYDREQREQSVSGAYQKDLEPGPRYYFRTDTAARAIFSAYSPSLSFSYRPAPNLQYYLGFNRGFRAGGLTGMSLDPAVPPLHTYQPEQSSSVEAGYKAYLINRTAFLQLAAFYTVVENVQVPTLVLPEGLVITRNTGKMISKGAEAEFRWMLIKDLQLDAAAGYTDARYERLLLAGNGSEADLKGNRQVFTPDITGSISLRYRKTVHAPTGMKLLLGAEWRYFGAQYFDLNNNIRQSPYSLLHGSAGLEAGSYALLGWIRNITDQRYISYGYDFGAVSLGHPLLFGLTFSASFGRVQ